MKGDKNLNVKAKDEWHNWSELLMSYRSSRLPLEEFIGEEKKVKKHKRDIDKVVSLEIARSMKTDLIETEKELECRIMYAINTISEDDMVAAGLSPSELQITTLRQQNSNKRVSEILKVSREYVWMTYKSAVEKILKYKSLKEKEKILYGLSPQQKEIAKLLGQGKSDKEIINELGITQDTLKTQKKRIRKKLGGTKTLNIQLQVKWAQI